MKSFIVVGEGRPAERMANYVSNLGILVAHIKEYTTLESYEFDYLISINNTAVISAEDLKRAKLALNMHPAPLPEYAGLYCHYWAIENGETQFGATIHTMTPEVDAGRIVAQELFEIKEREPRVVFIQAMNVGFRLMCGVINDLIWGEPLPFQEQDFSKRKLYTKQMAVDAGFVR